MKKISSEDWSDRIDGIDMIRNYEQEERRTELLEQLVQKTKDSNKKVRQRAQETVVSKYAYEKELFDKYPDGVVISHANLMSSPNRLLSSQANMFIESVQEHYKPAQLILPLCEATKGQSDDGKVILFKALNDCILAKDSKATLEQPEVLTKHLLPLVYKHVDDSKKPV